MRLGQSIMKSPSCQRLFKSLLAQLPAKRLAAVATTFWRPLATDPKGSGVTNGDIETCIKKLGDLSFNDTAEAFKSKSNWHLWRALIVLKLCSYPFLVERNMELMHLGQRVLGKRLFEKFMKATFYGHFVAGVDENDAKPTVQRLKAFGVKSILDYSVESDVDSPHNEAIAGVLDRRDHVISARTYYYEGEHECDRNADIFKRCIDSVHDYTGGAGFSVVKVTALGRPQLLLRLSDVIVKYQTFFKVLSGTTWDDLVDTKMSEQQFWARLDELGLSKSLSSEKRAELTDWFRSCDLNGDGRLDLYEWSRLLEHKFALAKFFKVINLHNGKVESLIPDLTENEQNEFSNLVDRLNYLASYADQTDIRMMIDAEQTYLQPAISRLTLELMRKYNKKKPVIFNTYQAYLKNALTNISIDLHVARRDDFYFGAKLVRGAYMVQERKRAEAMGYDDPINPDVESTSRMYGEVFKGVLEEAKRRPVGKVAIMCATHNEDTVRRVLRAMREQGVGPKQHTVCFGQLYGMCDQVSFSLGQAGFSVYKYVPYGPVNGVMPYLSRRMQENGGGAVLQKSSRERALIWSEIKRRYKRLKFVHNPMKHRNN